MSLAVMSSENLSLSIGGNTKVKAENGTYTFSQLNLISTPKFIANVKITSSAITASSFNSFEIPLTFRACISGEVLQNNKCV